MKRWPLHRAYFWERAPFFRLLLPLAAGIVAYPFLTIASYVALISLAVLFVLFGIATWRRQKAFSFITSQLCIAFIGCLLCYSNDIRNDKHWFGHKINTADFFEARVTETPAEKESTYKLRVSTISTMEPGQISPASGEGFVYVLKEDKPLPFAKGDTILLANKWKPIQNAGNPFEFNYAGYCARNNLYYQLLLPAKDIVSYAKGNAVVASLTERCHDWCMRQLARYIKDKQATGLIQAMLIGDEVNLDNETRQAFADTGIVHIIAISGGNVAIFFIVIGWLLWWLRHKKYQWLKYFIALPLVWFYIMMAGAPPSAVRAAIMFSLLAIGIMFQKNNNSLNTLFATAFILLCAQPMWLYSIGFQLSFIAVLSLIIFYGPIYKLYGAGNKLTKVLWQTIAASLAAEILVAPLVVYYFHLLPLLFIVANVAAYFFMGLVLILGIAVIACSFIPVLAQLLGMACVWLVGTFNTIVHWLQQCNPESFYYLQIDNAELFLIYVIIASLALWLLNKQMNGLAISLFSACLLLFLFCSDEYTALHQLKLVVYNTDKSMHAELLEGKKYTVLATDTSAKQMQKIVYATKSAHTGWHAWRQNELQDAPEILSIAGSNVLLYKDSVLPANMNMKADYILLCQPAKMDAEMLYNNFHPKCVVLPQVPEKQLEQWRMAAGKHSIAIHYLPEDGTFILE